MKNIKLTLLSILMLTAICSVFSQKHAEYNSDSAKYYKLYFGQNPPGIKPEIFAPGIISTEYHEFSCTFSPDGKEFYFTRRVPEFDRNRIMVSKLKEEGWTTPEIAPKTGDYEGMEPYITPDGQQFFFQSWRPIEGAAQTTMDIWVMNNTRYGWEKPVHLEHPFNPMRSMYFSMSEKGKLFTTDISGGMGTGKIVYTYKEGEKYADFKELSPLINFTGKEIYPCISFDESYILFTRRTDSGQSNIYVSFLLPDNTWDTPIMIDLELNNVSMPRLSPDGKYLFFTYTIERLKGDIYWVDAKIVENQKLKH